MAAEQLAARASPRFGGRLKRWISARVLRLADGLLKEKGDAEARRYFEKGLEGNAWALPEQLELGEILAKLKEQPALGIRLAAAGFTLNQLQTRDESVIALVGAEN